MNPSQAQQADREEPQITQEESVPSDGRDHDGEELMKQVRNPQLEEPAQAKTSTGKTPAGRSI